ncbi:hypothetical protein ARMGADRAFT_447104 [Armillaria gallica]|uniref:Nephrocystin 3-like N-terminal domain-containing protein n=1 Tax=Armillaria gallica TaxID=47427 RepID=A0A2H3CY20_ARMGA|nr:hypothetical protein ARMGADRAFT_447104 [Armillaria gallica]
MSDLVKGAPAISVYNNATPRLRIWTLSAYQINIEEAVEDGVNAANEPRTPSKGAGEFLQILQVAGAILDTLSEIHPIAQATSGILSLGLKTYKKQVETDELVLKLCETMKSIHELANSEHALQKQEDLMGIYNSMFEKTFECCVFINNYVKKGFLGRLSILNVSDMVTKYQKEFSNFKEDLSLALIKNTNYVAKETHEIVNKTHQTVRTTGQGVDMLNTSVELNKLIAQYKEAVETRPKCRCLKGTRIKTLEYLNSWIKHPDGVGCVLWCHGLAGTGKSSLAGTLHDDFVNNSDPSQSRLGAFVRYDRSTAKSSVSDLIPAIAYSLGQLDGQIGSAIAAVIKAHGPGIKDVSVKNQYDSLLGGPLNTVPELKNRGPLVIIIDGLDECGDITEPNLALDAFTALSKGFQDLTFMRLVVFSRRVEPITGMFEKNNIIVHPFSLNEPLDPILNDIQYFIEYELAKIEKSSNGFHKVMEHYPKATEELALKANGLFIWANIACRYLLRHQSPKAMEVLLKTNTSDNAAGHSNTGDSESKALKALHNLYITALDEASEGDTDLKECIMKILGAIMIAGSRKPLTYNYLNKLVLDENETSAQDILSKLGSVVEKYGDDDDDETYTERHVFIQLIHKSFDDFLTYQSLQRKDSWFISIKDHKRNLACKCLSVLTDFLKQWVESTDIPSHIRNYALLGPLWDREWFDKSDVKDLCVLFEDDLSAKWFKVIDKADKNSDLFREIIEVLRWVNSLKGIDFSFHHLIYCTFQCAESTLLSTTPEMQSNIKSQNVFWHNILPCSHLWIGNCPFSFSTDSQVLFANDASTVMSWDINDIEIQDYPDQKKMSSFFNSEEWLPALNLWSSDYHVLGHFVVRISTFVDDLSVDDHGGHWKVIDNRNSGGIFMAQDQSASVFISISNMQTSFCHHYRFKDLKQHNLLLYSTGIIIINTQAMVLMRIDVNAFANKHEWKMIVDGSALQAEYSSSWSSSPSLQRSSSESFFDHYIRLHKLHILRSLCLVVSKDGSTVAHLSRPVDDDRWMLQCWNIMTGDTFSITLNIGQQELLSLILSAKGTTSIIVTSRDNRTSLHIVSLDNCGAILEVIDVGNQYWSERNFKAAFFPDEQKITYLMENVMVIRDIQAQKDIFQHPFPSGDVPHSIMITPDGKTLITFHHEVIRTWCVEGL